MVSAGIISGSLRVVKARLVLVKLTGGGLVAGRGVAPARARVKAEAVSMRRTDSFRARQTLSYRHPVIAASHTVFSWLTSGGKFPGNRSRSMPTTTKTRLNPLPALPFPVQWWVVNSPCPCIGVWGATGATVHTTRLSKWGFGNSHLSHFQRAGF